MYIVYTILSTGARLYEKCIMRFRFSIPFYILFIYEIVEEISKFSDLLIEFCVYYVPLALEFSYLKSQ